MKTVSEIKFDRIIKEGFHELLKPLGFKKKANNFYLQLDNIGQIINVQKSAWGTKDSISFTINIGIFVPEYWLAYYNFQEKEVPKFPNEPECLIRKRIGTLRNQLDTWYDIKERTDENQIIAEMKKNVEDFILPYFKKIDSRNKLLDTLDKEDLAMGKLIIYGELRQYDKAKNEYQKLLKGKTNPHFWATIKEYGQKYGLD